MMWSLAAPFLAISTQLVGASRLTLRILVSAVLPALVLVFVQWSALATQQIRDPVIWDGRTNYPVQGPDIWGAFAKEQLPKFDWHSTANYKSYKAVWEIRDGTLFLLALQAEIQGSPVSLELVFPSKPTPIAATWFSGTIIIPCGKLIGLWRGHARDVYTKETHLVLEKGNVIKIVTETHDPLTTPVWNFGGHSPSPAQPLPLWPRRKF
jgi:hypothetical protein